MALFEGYERRIDKINAELPQYGFESIEQTRDYCLEHGVDVASIVLGIQPIAFENAVWAYTLGAAIALRSGSKSPSRRRRRSGWACRRSASPALWRTAARSAWATATSPPCCSTKNRMLLLPGRA